ncbi:MAG: hypothetical protein ACKVU1_06180 [bacterium]
MRGGARGHEARARACLGDAIALHGPLERPAFNVGVMRRALLGLGGAKPAALVVAGGDAALDLAPRLASWLERPCIYLAFTEDDAFPWKRRKALDAFAKTVAHTRRMTHRLVDTLGLPEERVATIYPAADLDAYSPRPLPEWGSGGAMSAVGVASATGAAGADGAVRTKGATAEAPLVGLAGAPSDAMVASLRAACPGVRFGAPGARAPLVDLGAEWSPDAVARIALLLVVPGADLAGAYDAVVRAMAGGRAVLSAIPEDRLDATLIDGETGERVADASPSAIADALTRLLASRDLLASMGSGGRLLAAGSYDRARRRSEYDALLRVVCGIPFPPSAGARGADAPGIPIQFRGLTKSQKNV